jgi:hypothetical protein
MLRLTAYKYQKSHLSMGAIVVVVRNTRLKPNLFFLNARVTTLVPAASSAYRFIFSVYTATQAVFNAFGGMMLAVGREGGVEVVWDWRRVRSRRACC